MVRYFISNTYFVYCSIIKKNNMCYSEWSNNELEWELENLNMELDCGGLSYDQEMYLINICCDINEEIDKRNK